MPEITYAEAIHEATDLLLKNDPDVFVLGQGLWSPWYVGSTMTDLDKKYGRERVIDSPVSENATTGAGIGAAITGMRPIVVHPRMDFMLLASDQIVNQAANWAYMFAGQASVPVVIRAIINRGGEQGAQHSQSMHAWFAHIPGLRVVMPSTPYDAKGLLISAVYDDNPVLYIDDRWLYEVEGEVPDESYEVPIGQANVYPSGSDISIIANSFLAEEARQAADAVKESGIEAEVVDLRTVNPIDRTTILHSVAKTRRALIVDGGWSACGVSAEVAAIIAESDVVTGLQAPLKRLTLPPAPAPTASSQELAYYPRAAAIVEAVKDLCANGS